MDRKFATNSGDKPTRKDGLTDMTDFINREQAAERLRQDIVRYFSPDSEEYRVMHAQLAWLLGTLNQAERRELERLMAENFPRKLSESEMVIAGDVNAE